MKNQWLVIDKKVLPEVFEKVIKAKRLLKEGTVREITEATKQVGISRSVYYKYKDYVFEFSETSYGKKFIFNMVVTHKKGVLSSVLNLLSEYGANILTIDQSIPINNSAYVSITIDISSVDVDIYEILSQIGSIDGVEKTEFVAME
ncbi:ACT domain-containing protein [uncultured Clostridium sp.]|jgi:chorismate mutase|uniref:ACT domain-containing protein n=1 Tax=uncultured Clostridium sp. TaxID=59620 RepID=UPI002615A546|nr:ACT domain-containing protein [uncultured Clostridium sp.]